MIKKTNKATQRTFIEYIGWAGVILVVLSYSLLAFKIVDSESVVYHLLVLTGSIGVATISYIKRVYQPAVLNSIFAILASIALARIVLF